MRLPGGRPGTRLRLREDLPETAAGLERGRLHELLPAELRAAVDSSHIRALTVERRTCPPPVGRGKSGGKHHVIIEAHRFQITPHIARRGTEHGSGLGGYRWVMEGALALVAIGPCGLIAGL